MLMRRTFFGIFLAILLCAPAAMAKQKEELPPLFMAPDFHFSQIDSICLAPTIDLRADKSLPLPLSGWTVDVEHVKSIDADIPDKFKTIGYPTVKCSSVSAMSGDLNAPTEAWLRGLDFGPSHYLFILAVEGASSQHGRELVPWSSSSHAAYAVLSAFLFEKQTSGVKLDWRDRVVGRTAFSLWSWSKEGLQRVQIGEAIRVGVELLLMKFETRNKKIRPLFEPRMVSYEEDIACNVLWPTLNDVLKNSGKYDIIGVYDSTLMVVYALGRGHSTEEKRIDYAILKGREHGCTMQVTEVGRTNGPDSLKKEVQASLTK